MSEKKIVYYVTGATGWVGHTVVNELLKRNANIVIFALPNDRMLSLFDNVKDKISIVLGNVTKEEDCEKFLSCNSENAIQKVIHVAGIVSVSGKFSQIVYDVNVTGTKNMANVALKHNVDRFVYVSTSHALKELPNQQTMAESFDYQDDERKGNYAITKAEATKYVIDLAEKGLKSVVIHPTAVIGPNDPMDGYMTSMFKAFLSHHLPGSVKGAYDLIDVRDLAILLIDACEKGKKGNNYIASGHRLEITDLINTIAKLENRKPIRVTLSFGFVKAVAPLYEWLCKIFHKKALYTKYSLIAVGSNSHFSNEKAKRELGFNPRPVEESILDTAEYVIKKFPECQKKEKRRNKHKK